MADPEIKKTDDYYVQALLLAEVVKRILSRKAELNLSAKPTLTLKPVIEFRKRMRVASLGRFIEKTFISTISFYKNEQDMDQSKAVGSIVIYIPERFITILFRAMDYPPLEEEDTAAMTDACGTFCNLAAGNFKTGLTQLGYDELIMSHFETYENEIVDGISYPLEQKQYYEINFELKNEKCISADLVMGEIPRLYSL